MTEYKTNIIQAGSEDYNYWRDLWTFKELFYVLAWRDLALRYKQTIIGVSWALIRPFINMIVFTIVFGKLAKLPTDANAPYALMVFAGMLPWQFFATAFSDCANSLVNNASLIGKVYFPRLIIPISVVFVAFVDFLISFVILVGLMIWYQFLPGWQILFLPLFTLMAFLAILGPGLLISSLNVKYRDFRYIIPFLVQFGLYISPVGFSTNVIPEKWKLIYSLNPLVGVIDGFRWAILGGDMQIYIPGFLLSLVVILVSMFVGIKCFKRTEKSFADII